MPHDPATSTRVFTYAEARDLLREVRRFTAASYEAAEVLAVKLRACPDDRAALERLERAVRGWFERVEALGLQAKGLWLVDFDNGAGYYCWRWPEADLEFFHGYDDGFNGRVRIQ